MSLSMEVSSDANTRNVYCAHCETHFEEKSACAYHFVENHLFSENQICNLCKIGLVELTTHIVNDHPNHCVYCLTEANDRVHLSCMFKVRSALNKKFNYCVLQRFFESRQLTFEEMLQNACFELNKFQMETK